MHRYRTLYPLSLSIFIRWDKWMDGRELTANLVWDHHFCGNSDRIEFDELLFGSDVTSS